MKYNCSTNKRGQFQCRSFRRRRSAAVCVEVVKLTNSSRGMTRSSCISNGNVGSGRRGESKKVVVIEVATIALVMVVKVSVEVRRVKLLKIAKEIALQTVILFSCVRLKETQGILMRFLKVNQ